MAYASANTEVKGYTGFTTDYSTGTSPTLTQVSDIIAQVEGEIDTTLAGIGLTVPVTNSNLIAYVRKYSGMGSAGLTLQRYGKNDADYRLADWFYSKFETWIDKLITDEKLQKNIKNMGVTGYSGLYVGSNATDGSHTGADVRQETISYGVEESDF